MYQPVWPEKYKVGKKEQASGEAEVGKSEWKLNPTSKEKMLYIIGLGLGDERDITLKGLEAIQKSDKVYMEAYTSLLSFGLSSDGLSNLVSTLPFFFLFFIIINVNHQHNQMYFGYILEYIKSTKT